eukprot:5477286-Pyramimonas_sp.AAC.1
MSFKREASVHNGLNFNLPPKVRSPLGIPRRRRQCRPAVRGFVVFFDTAHLDTAHLDTAHRSPSSLLYFI